MSPKLCMYPFTRMEIGDDKFIPCCFHWLKDSFHQMDNRGEDPWNSPAALELRARILKGDYSLCRRDVCNIPLKTLEEIEQVGSGISECIVSPSILSSLKNGHSFIESGPTAVALVIDQRCNLACPSCRPGKITKLSEHEKLRFYEAIQMLKKHKKTIQTVKLAGDGEVFFSPWLRKLLKICHPGNFPALGDLNILTNGLLCTPEMFERLRPGSDSITEISVSMDAGNAATYAKTRGGDWNRLMKNLEFIATLRAKGRIKRFVISFVARKENISSADDFVNIGHRYGADMIYFLTFDRWSRSTLPYEEEAIHYQSHPDHQEFLNFYQKHLQSRNVFMGIQPLSYE